MVIDIDGRKVDLTTRHRLISCVMSILRLTLIYLGTINPLSQRSGGGTGRHVCLRGICRKVWGFESPPEHQAKLLDDHLSALNSDLMADIGRGSWVNQKQSIRLAG